MPIDADAGFVAQIKVQARKQPDAGEFLLHVLRRLRGRMAAWDRAGIYFLIGETLVPGPYLGEGSHSVSIPIGTGLRGTAVTRDSNILVEDTHSHADTLIEPDNTRSVLIVPIRDRGEIVALFDVSSDRVRAFRRQDEVLLERLAAIVGPHCRSERDRIAIEGTGPGGDV